MSSRTTSLHTTRRAILLGLTLVLFGVFATAAAAQTTTLTVRVGVVPATDPGRFDLAIDGVALASGVGDGGGTVAQTVLPGTFTVSEVATTGTNLSSYSTTVTCLDGSEVLVAAAPLTATAVVVAAGHDVVCTFINTLLPVAPVVAPPVTAKPILLPPAFVRGTAILRGVEGCTARKVVTTRIIGRNISRIVFFRDGRIVKRVKAPSLSWRAYEMTTVVPAGDHQLHTVLVRAYFVDGATPRVKAMVHRFAHCRSSEVVS
jgi:hypothetical protein